jgi:hypothetical protein
MNGSNESLAKILNPWGHKKSVSKTYTLCTVLKHMMIPKIFTIFSVTINKIEPKITSQLQH